MKQSTTRIAHTATQALLATFCSITLAGNVSGGADAALYDRLGGHAVIAEIVDELVERSRVDPNTNRSFKKVNIKRLKEQIAEQLCTLTGGPCKFSGDDMKTSHAGLDITQAEFYAMVEHLIEILDAHQIGTREKNQLLALLAPMKRDVVSK